MAMTATTGRATSTPATASAILVRRGRRGWDRGMGNSLLFSLLQAISIAEAAPRLMIFSPKFAPGGDACFRAYDVNSLRYVRQRTESPAASAYNGSHREQDIRLTVMRRKTMSTRLSRTTLQLLGALAIAVAAVGCASDKTPATADVAISRAAVDSATSSGAAELAPAELTSARDKMMKANQALAARITRPPRNGPTWPPPTRNWRRARPTRPRPPAPPTKCSRASTPCVTNSIAATPTNSNKELPS